MKKWNDREFNIVEWVITYISELSVEERYRSGIRRLKERPVLPLKGYGTEEREALIAAIIYFEDFYRYAVKGAPRGNRTVKETEARLTYLRGAREKLEASEKE